MNAKRLDLDALMIDAMDDASSVVSLDGEHEGGDLLSANSEYAQDLMDTGFALGSSIPSDPFAFNEGIESLFGEEDDDLDLGPEGAPAPDDSYTPSIDEGDFLDPAQRFIFKRLKASIRAACNVNSKPAERSRALDWICIQSTKDADGIEFEPACRALGGRPVVIRARTMHQLWKANIMLNEPLPFLAAIPPRSIMSEISSLVGPGLPVDMAREIWYWPSIPGEELRAKFADVSQREYEAALGSLDANGYIAIAFARIYFISRNPTIMGVSGRNRFEFAHSIYGDD